MPSTQSAQSHTAIDPITHLVLMPFYLLTLVLAIVLFFEARGADGRLLHGWLVLLAGSFCLLNVRTRRYSLTLQDRMIRLEERVRLSALLSPAHAAEAVSRLDVRQLIALRFASDAELPGLVARTLAEELPPKAIKAAIVSWRPDLSRV